jgi:hypothetical protein
MTNGLSPRFMRGGVGQSSMSASNVTSRGPILTGATTSGPGAFGELGQELGDAASGRVSLILLDTLVIGLLAFYWWTRHAQGGG